MNSLYDYFNNIIDNNKLSHSFLIGNITFDEIKNDLYKVFNNFIFKNELDNDNNPDVYIIKQEKGIISKDAIKDLLSEISTTSQFNNSKIYVIDGAEKLNDFSYNAILKTLEEPQDNIYAFLLTSNIESIKETISSRCQKIFISSESTNIIEDDSIREIADNLLEYINKLNIKTIGVHPEIYSIIDSRETFVQILNYLLKINIDILNEMVYSDKKDNIEEQSKKLLIINEAIEEAKNYLNKNLMIDRFIIKMWRCMYENS